MHVELVAENERQFAPLLYPYMHRTHTPHNHVSIYSQNTSSEKKCIHDTLDLNVLHPRANQLLRLNGHVSMLGLLSHENTVCADLEPIPIFYGVDAGTCRLVRSRLGLVVVCGRIIFW